MTTLKDIREKLHAQERRPARSRDNASFAFWNVPMDKSARIRFLPDKDPDNIFFWIEKQLIELTFPGILKNNETKEVKIRVPCMEMWGETCPIIAETRPWWNDDKLQDLARRFWKKRSYHFQGFVRECPFSEDDLPENPIRTFSIRPQIFNIIKASLLDPDFESLPTDYATGTDFMITKSRSGDNNSYITSKWARKETPLTDDEVAAVDEHGLRNLSDVLPKKPDDEHQRVIYEMFEASVEGHLYDPARWAKFYRPYGLQANAEEDPGVKVGASISVSGANLEPASSPTESVGEADNGDDDIPFDTADVAAASTDNDAAATEKAPSTDVNAILDMIKQRKNQ